MVLKGFEGYRAQLDNRSKLRFFVQLKPGCVVEFCKGSCCGNYTHVEFLTGNSCEKFINHRSSGRNRTHTCAMSVHCSDH